MVKNLNLVPIIQVTDVLPATDDQSETPELPRYTYRALCEGCEHNRVKDVNKSAEWCPDCGHALYWERNVA